MVALLCLLFTCNKALKELDTNSDGVNEGSVAGDSKENDEGEDHGAEMLEQGTGNLNANYRKKQTSELERFQKFKVHYEYD